MEGRGRKSAASLALVPVGPVEVIDRLDAPAELNDEERAEWLAVVERMPADWFGRETAPLLAQYARHVVHARRVGEMINAFVTGQDADGKAVEFDVKTFDRLSRMQERESRAIAMLATKMRISQQSTYDKSRRKGAPGKRPWETE